MIGKAMTMRISSRGEISDFKAPEGMFEGIKKTPGMQQMGGIFSDQGLKQMVTQAMLKFPEKEIVKGDSWTSLLEMPNPAFGNQKVESTYTYAGSDTIDGRQAEAIDLKLNITFMAAKDSPTKVELKDQSSKGTIHFDNAKGRLIDTESTMTMKMEITVGAMKFESNTSVGVTLKRNEDKKSSSQPAEK